MSKLEAAALFKEFSIDGEPTKFHFAIQELQKIGILKVTATTNIDGFETRLEIPYIALHGDNDFLLCYICHNSIHFSHGLLLILNLFFDSCKCHNCKGNLQLCVKDKRSTFVCPSSKTKKSCSNDDSRIKNVEVLFNQILKATTCTKCENSKKSRAAGGQRSSSTSIPQCIVANYNLYEGQRQHILDRTNSMGQTIVSSSQKEKIDLLLVIGSSFNVRSIITVVNDIKKNTDSTVIFCNIEEPSSAASSLSDFYCLVDAQSIFENFLLCYNAKQPLVSIPQQASEYSESENSEEDFYNIYQQQMLKIPVRNETNLDELYKSPNSNGINDDAFEVESKVVAPDAESDTEREVRPAPSDQSDRDNDVVMDSLSLDGGNNPTHSFDVGTSNRPTLQLFNDANYSISNDEMKQFFNSTNCPYSEQQLSLKGFVEGSLDVRKCSEQWDCLERRPSEESPTHRASVELLTNIAVNPILGSSNSTGEKQILSSQNRMGLINEDGKSCWLIAAVQFCMDPIWEAAKVASDSAIRTAFVTLYENHQKCIYDYHKIFIFNLKSEVLKSLYGSGVMDAERDKQQDTFTAVDQIMGALGYKASITVWKKTTCLKDFEIGLNQTRNLDTPRWISKGCGAVIDLEETEFGSLVRLSAWRYLDGTKIKDTEVLTIQDLFDEYPEKSYNYNSCYGVCSQDLDRKYHENGKVNQPPAEFLRYLNCNTSSSTLIAFIDRSVVGGKVGKKMNNPIILEGPLHINVGQETIEMEPFAGIFHIGKTAKIGHYITRRILNGICYEFDDGADVREIESFFYSPEIFSAVIVGFKLAEKSNSQGSVLYMSKVSVSNGKKQSNLTRICKKQVPKKVKVI